MFGVGRSHGLPCAECDSGEECDKNGCGRGDRAPMTPNELAQAIEVARGPREDGFAFEVSLNVMSQSAYRLVSPGAVLFARFHDDPIQIASQGMNQFQWL